MLSGKFHEQVIALYQVCFNHLAVIVVYVDIIPAQKSICQICRCDIHDHIILPQQHNGCQIETSLAGNRIFAIQTCVFQEFFI